MRTNFIRTDMSESGDDGFKFFNWAIIVVAAGLLIAATSGEFASKQDAKATVAHAPAHTTVVSTVAPSKT